jgi:trk system potassium uptake protein
VARTLMQRDQEVVLIESGAARADMLEEEFGHRVVHGDGTELYVLERAGVTRPPDIVVAVTGDDEDNLVISQLSRERYGVAKVIARVNDPRNQEHFDLLGISPTVCPTQRIMALIEHEVPEHDLVHLLELRGENLEIIEVGLDGSCPCIGKAVDAVGLPSGSRLISVVRDGTAEIAMGGTVLKAGDQVLAILQPGREDEVRDILLGR